MPKITTATTATTRVKASAASAQRPTGVAPRKPVPVVPAADDGPDGTYRGHPALQTLPELVAQYRDLQLQTAALDALDAQRKALGQDIEALLLAAEQRTVSVGDLQVTRVETAGRKTLSEERLLALGVPADVIVQATVFGKPSSHVRVTVLDEAKQGARDRGTAATDWAARRRA